MYCKISYGKTVELHGGSGTRADRIKAHYQSLGYTGTFYDMEMSWLADRGRTGTFVDRWNQEFAAAGYSKGTLWDKLKNWTWPIVAVLGAFFNAKFWDSAYYHSEYWAA